MDNWTINHSKNYAVLNHTIQHKNIIQSYIKRNQKILDYGCGSGLLVELLRGKYNITGYDINKDVITTAKTLFPHSKLTNVLPNDKYNCIVLSHVIEHTHKPQLMLNQIHNLLLPNGIIIVTTPNSQSIHTLLINAKGHVQHYTINSLSQELIKSHYQIIKSYLRIYPISTLQAIFQKLLKRDKPTTKIQTINKSGSPLIQKLIEITDLIIQPIENNKYTKLSQEIIILARRTS